MAELREPEWRNVDQLARALMLAQDVDKGRGRAVFLVGAGCSVSAGIPAASGVSRRVALHLAKIYSHGAFAGTDPDKDADDALRSLVAGGHIEASHAPSDGGTTDWGALYQYFFAQHLTAPNQQRELINALIGEAGGKLNWAHACLGELVGKRYVNTVLTTNFDQLVLTGIFRTGIIPVVADGLHALNRIVAEPLVPQVIHLHGSMSTYAMRNDPKALAEPLRDHRSVTMLNSLLQRADLLVVVGYAGGEEGLMDLLLQAADSLEQLVIYWVTYGDEATGLTNRCRTLLSGENKYAIVGGEADRFFGDLMAALGVGQPDWVADPIGELHRHRVELVASDAVEGASILIEAYRGRIEAANQLAKPAEDARQKAARLRVAGDYTEARKVLEGVDLAGDPSGARLHALNALSLFEQAPEENRAMLDAAVAEFEALIAATVARERLENVLSLLDALFDMFEMGSAAGDGVALDRIVATATHWLDASDGEEAVGRGRLLFYRAQAHQRHAEAAGEDVGEMELAVADYRASLAALERAPDRLVSTEDAREGLAAALQVLGAKQPSEERAREAVQLFREGVEHSRRDATRPENEGGLYYNLSGALLDLMDRVDAEEAYLLAGEATAALGRAELAFMRANDAPMLEEVRRQAERLAAAAT